MVDIQPVKDILGLGRLADTIRQGEIDEQNRGLAEQQAVTMGLQQESLGLGIEQKRQSLSDLAAGRQGKADLTAAVQGSQPGESKTMAAINFLKGKDPAKAQELITSTLENAGKISKFNPQGGIDFVNKELGTNWTLEEETPDTFKVNQGDKISLINKSTGEVIKEFPVTAKAGEQKQTSLIQNLEAAGLKQGTPAFQQAVLANIQKSGRTQTIEVGPDGGIKIIERAGPQEQKTATAQAEAAEADKKRTDNAIGQANTVINKVDQVLENVGLGTAGVGSLFSIIPGTPAKDIAANIETLKANLAFNALQAMREASKTGGALGAVSERELSLLESQIASLDPKQSPEQLRTNLGEVRSSFENMLNKANKPEAQKPDEVIKVFNFDSQGNLIQ